MHLSHGDCLPIPSLLVLLLPSQLHDSGLTRVQGIVADVSISADRKTLIEAVSLAFEGRLDIFVSNSGRGQVFKVNP